MTKVYTTNIEKGGPGKTTITFNGAHYLAEKNQRVLLADLDPSMNLTNRFITSDQSEPGSVKELFTRDQKIIPRHVKPNIDLIPGSTILPSLINEIKDGQGKQYMLNWFFKNLDNFIEPNYDFILIDTHNDHSIIVENAVVISDVVLAPVDVDSDSLIKIAQEEAFVEDLKQAVIADPRTGESWCNATVIKIGNKVEHNTADSLQFKEAFDEVKKTDNSFLGYFEKRTPFAKAKTENVSIYELMNDPRFQSASYKKFFKKTNELMQKIFGV